MILPKTNLDEIILCEERVGIFTGYHSQDFDNIWGVRLQGRQHPINIVIEAN